MQISYDSVLIRIISKDMYHYLTLIFSCIISFVGCLNEGDSCILNTTGQKGKCERILNCKAALEDVKNQKFPQPCGFASVALVCCIDGAPPLITTTTTTTTQRTTTVKLTGRINIPTRAPSNLILINPYKSNDPGYRSFEKCLEYSKLVFTYKKPPILIIDKEEIKKNTCGFRVVPLIVGGKPASRREFPHMALVGYDAGDKIEWLCGGTLISESYVLTAAHCLRSSELGNATHVRMGVTQINSPGHRQDRNVIDWIKYPDYLEPALYHDIGLLKLEKTVDFNIYVRPACLHNAKNALGDSAIATGWGRNATEGYSSDQLLKVTLDFSDPTTCFNSFRRISKSKLGRGVDDELMVCAGSFGKDTCQGDSGGPLQIYSPIDCMYEIIGVTSFGKTCGSRSPGVYTRVSHYIEWLEKIVFE